MIITMALYSKLLSYIDIYMSFILICVYSRVHLVDIVRMKWVLCKCYGTYKRCKHLLIFLEGPRTNQSLTSCGLSSLRSTTV